MLPSNSTRLANERGDVTAGPLVSKPSRRGRTVEKPTLTFKEGPCQCHFMLRTALVLLPRCSIQIPYKQNM